MGKSTGLVTTSTMTDATPAAFAAHNSSRWNYPQIASDYLFVIRPNILLGGGNYGWNALEAVSAGYTIVTNLSSLQAIDTETATHVAGVFGHGVFPSEYDGLGDLPTLSQMTTTALDILDNDPEGLFLLVEHEGTDTYGHENDIQRSIFAAVELSNAVQIALDWAAGRDDTLIVVTADHETGGLSVTQNNGEGNMPTVSWSTLGHTNLRVPVYAVGPNSNSINGIFDNTRLRAIMLGDEFSCPYYVPTKIRLSEVKALSGSWSYRGVLVLIAIAGMGFIMILFRESRRKKEGKQ
jgi:alkaline phosphatase